MTPDPFGHFDLAFIALYLFWAFFLGLIIYISRESAREGFPLVIDNMRGEPVATGHMWMPAPKTFKLMDGTTVQSPPPDNERKDLALAKTAPFFGAPFEPTGNPMLDGVGPGSYANRAHKPSRMVNGQPAIVPMRIATDFHVDERDPNPIGMKVLGADGVVGGTVTDIWVDRPEHIIRYFEVEVPTEAGTRRVLLPHNFCRIDGNARVIRVKAILGHQFQDVPGTESPDQVTLYEEDRIVGYYGGGYLYAEPSRKEPLT